MPHELTQIPDLLRAPAISEAPNSLDVLRELGVEAAQGYLFGQPRPIDSYTHH